MFQRFRKKYAGRADTCLSMVCADGLTLDVLFPTEEAFTDWHEALMVVLGQVSREWASPSVCVSACAFVRGALRCRGRRTSAHTYAHTAPPRATTLLPHTIVPTPSRVRASRADY